MKEQLISKETAKLAKEKGFRFNREDDERYDIYEPNRMAYYYHKRSKAYFLLGDFYCDTNANFQQYNLNDKYPSYDAPAQSLLQKWIYENYKIWVEVLPLAEDLKNGMYWSVRIFDLNKGRVLAKTISGTGSPYPLIEKALQESLNLIP